MNYLTDYNVLKDIYFEKSSNEIDCLRARKVKKIGDGLGKQAKQDFRSQHDFLKCLQETLNYKPDYNIRRKSDQLITQSRVPAKLLELSNNKNKDHHIESARRLSETRDSIRQSKASSVQEEQDQEEQELVEDDDSSSEDGMPFEKADEVIEQIKDSDTFNMPQNQESVKKRAYSIVVEKCTSSTERDVIQNEQENSAVNDQYQAEIFERTVADTFSFNHLTTQAATPNHRIIKSKEFNLKNNTESTKQRINDFQQTLKQKTIQLKQSRQKLVIPVKSINFYQKAETSSLNNCSSQASTNYASSQNSSRKVYRRKAHTMGISIPSSFYSTQSNSMSKQNLHPHAIISPQMMSRNSFVDSLRHQIRSQRVTQRPKIIGAQDMN